MSPACEGGGFFCAVWRLRVPQKADLHARHGATKLQASRLGHGNKHHRLTEQASSAHKTGDESHRASAETHACFGRSACVLRPRYVCASDGVHACFGRDTCVLRPKQVEDMADLTMRYGRGMQKEPHFADARAALRHDGPATTKSDLRGFCPLGRAIVQLNVSAGLFQSQLGFDVGRYILAQRCADIGYAGCDIHDVDISACIAYGLGSCLYLVGNDLHLFARGFLQVCLVVLEGGLDAV